MVGASAGTTTAAQRLLGRLGITWRPRPFPNANLLTLGGDEPAVVDTGFAAHVEETLGLVREAGVQARTVVNTHWHSDHVGGNAVFQRSGAQIIASAPDAQAVNGRDPGCCLSEYLDQPVPQYTVDRAVRDGERLLLGPSEWEVVAVPGHTPGHIALWEPERRVLIVGDTVTAHDVGWVNVMLEGSAALDAAVSSLRRMQELDPALILPGHGPALEEPGPALETALGRLERQRADLDRAVSYGARRILGYALMLRDGLPAAQLSGYLLEQPWLHDAAALLGERPEVYAEELVTGMLDSGALSLRDGVVRAATPYTPSDPGVFALPTPRDWEPKPLSRCSAGLRPHP